MDPSLASFNTTLQGHSHLQEVCEIEPRPYQITLTPRGDVPSNWILELVLELVAVDGPPGRRYYTVFSLHRHPGSRRV